MGGVTIWSQPCTSGGPVSRPSPTPPRGWGITVLTDTYETYLPYPTDVGGSKQVAHDLRHIYGNRKVFVIV